MFRPVPAAEVRNLASRLPPPRIFFFDLLSRGAVILARASAAAGALIVFEPSHAGFPELFHEALALAHVVKYAAERRPFLPRDISCPETLLEVETRGRAGLRYRGRVVGGGGRRWRHLPAFQVKQLRDTAGCGDWFTAGLLDRLGRAGRSGLERASRTEIAEGLRYGQALAAWNCGFTGAWGAFRASNPAECRSVVTRILAGQAASASSDNRGLEAEKWPGWICPRCVGTRPET
jgi:fructokinase